MEEKVTIALKIIDEGGDSFAQRAEMYYKKRPEIINFVEECYRAYRALAERYDHLSRELQSANRTIATAFPERVQYAMDDEEHHQETLTSDQDNADPGNTNIPSVPKVPSKEIKSPTKLLGSRKGMSFRRIVNAAKAASAKKEASGLTKSEALEEINGLQKGILALQTEKEFAKSLYEQGYKKFWEIENRITETHKRVSRLQDEFGVVVVIEDDEARTLMAATALSSCQETLAKLQEKQERSAEEAGAEQERIREAHEKFESLRAKFMFDGAESKRLERDDGSVGSDECSAETLKDKIKEDLDLGSESSLSVAELAEKIDELVSKVVTLETVVSSQTALAKRLGSDTDQLQSHVRSLEEDKESLKEGSVSMSIRLKELEEELVRVKSLNQSFKAQNKNLRTHFSEASCSLDHLSGKLQSVKHDEGSDNKQEVILDEKKTNKTEADDDDSLVSKAVAAEEEEKKETSVLEKSLELEVINHSDLGDDVGTVAAKPEDTNAEKEEPSKPSLRQLFLKGIEDREKLLLEEYTSVLQDYKEVKKKLSEVENKNRDSIFELAMQIRELKGDIATKDEEIKSLKHKFDSPQLNHNDSPFTCSCTSHERTNWGQDSASENERSNSETIGKLVDLEDKSCIGKENQNNADRNKAAVALPLSTIEEKFRSDIDGLLEENLEFWLRFSTSVHQIQKFESSIEDLHLELKKLREHKKKPEAMGSLRQHSIQSDARPIYRHLREIQTEMSLWFEHNAVLKDELQGRFSSLCNIQNEISRVSTVGVRGEKQELSGYQAAKFHGEILNMKQENNKVADELRVGLNRVRGLKVDVEKTLVRLNDELGIYAPARSDPYSMTRPPIQRPRIPLRSFLFGVKLKRQKPSIFSCVSPSPQRHHGELPSPGPLSS